MPPYRSGSAKSCARNEKVQTGPLTPMEVLENVTREENWPRQVRDAKRGSGPHFRPHADPQQ